MSEKFLVVIENDFTGPLAHKPTRAALEEAIATSDTLDELAVAIEEIPDLAVYLGSNHIAVHPTHLGAFASGSERLALIVPKVLR